MKVARGSALVCLIGYVMVQVQRQHCQDVGILKGSTDDATGACSVLDGVRDPPPRGSPPQVSSCTSVLGGISATGCVGPPAVGCTSDAVLIAATPED